MGVRKRKLGGESNKIRANNCSHISAVLVVIEQDISLVVVVEEFLHLRRPLSHSGADEVHVHVRERESRHQLFLVELRGLDGMEVFKSRFIKLKD